MGHAEAQTMFSTLDQDGSGSIDEHEFMSAMGVRLYACDAAVRVACFKPKPDTRVTCYMQYTETGTFQR